jgi:hypothetical protein
VPWNTLAGVIEWWADEGLRDLGRQRFHQERGTGTQREPSVPLGTVVLIRAAFVALRSPWRMAQIRASAIAPGDAAVVAWADNATAVLKGNPAEQVFVGPDETWGDLVLSQMLLPHSLDVLVSPPWEDQFRIDGTALEQEESMSIAPGLVSLASDSYAATFDPNLDVLTEWSAFMEGRVAQRISVTHLSTLE